MVDLNPNEFAGVKFYHGTDKSFDELLPVNAHGGIKKHGVTRPDSAYVTTSEEDAWKWSGVGDDSGEPRRVYEIDPYGDVSPDRNTNGPQFEIAGGRVARELPGPVNSQLRLFPDSAGRQFTTFENIATRAANAANNEVSEERYQSLRPTFPQKTTLFDNDVEMRALSKGGEFPASARSPTSEAMDKYVGYADESVRWSVDRRERSREQSAAGMGLRNTLEGPRSTPTRSVRNEPSGKYSDWDLKNTPQGQEDEIW